MKERDGLQVAAVIIPTYNEAGAIGALLEEVAGIASSGSRWRIEVIVVDGCSEDGTAGIVEAAAARGALRIHLLREPERQGIGAAYCRGFRYAIEEVGADAVIEFDGDLQHPPSHIPQLLQALDDGADYVAASRRMEGGSEPAGRSAFRKALTSLGGGAARFILFFPHAAFRQVTDPTTGLKATRVAGFADSLCLDPSRLVSRGFGYKLQWLSETLRLGARYREIPLRFQDRRAGRSKFAPPVIADILWTCAVVRASDPRTKRFIRYAAAGSAGYIVNAAALALLYRLTGIEALSWALSAEAAIICNYALNNVWAFGDRRKTGFSSWFGGFLAFNLASLGAIAIEGVFGPLLTSLVGPSYRQLVLAAVVLFMVVPYNWLMYSRLIWKQR
ncbi:MAG: glycosyltransferase [Patescibacteria group bacterium]|nr:glycosyltransferase [Patescibacteria group bacterium]